MWTIEWAFENVRERESKDGDNDDYDAETMKWVAITCNDDNFLRVIETKWTTMWERWKWIKKDDVAMMRWKRNKNLIIY